MAKKIKNIKENIQTDTILMHDDNETVLKPAVMPRKKTRVSKSTAVTRADPLRRYLWEISQYPILSKEEEQELFKKYSENHDPDIARRIIIHNLRLVVKIAMEYYYRVHHPLGDLIQEGNVGLVHAVKKYDRKKGVRFPSYAQYWIRAFLMKFLMDNYSMVKIATTNEDKKLFYNLRKAKEKLKALGLQPTPVLLAEHLQTHPDHVIEMDKRLSQRDTSIDAAIGDDTETTLADSIALAHNSFEEAYIESDMQDQVAEKMKEFRNTLNEREQYIWDKRLVAHEPITLEEIARKYTVSREAIRQQEERLIKKLRLWWEEYAPDLLMSDMRH